MSARWRQLDPHLVAGLSGHTSTPSVDYSSPGIHPVMPTRTHGIGINPQYQDDVDALVHYGSMGLWPGLADPTNFGDFKAWRTLGFGTGAAIAMTVGRAVLVTAVLGWAIDWDDKREGGFAETDFWQERGPHTWAPRVRRNWDRMWD